MDEDSDKRVLVVSGMNNFRDPGRHIRSMRAIAFLKLNGKIPLGRKMHNVKMSSHLRQAVIDFMNDSEPSVLIILDCYNFRKEIIHMVIPMYKVLELMDDKLLVDKILTNVDMVLSINNEIEADDIQECMDHFHFDL